jgi:hypothetical protein
MTRRMTDYMMKNKYIDTEAKRDIPEIFLMCRTQQSHEAIDKENKREERRFNLCLGRSGKYLWIIRTPIDQEGNGAPSCQSQGQSDGY